jgi:hypothetical protein
VLKRFSRFAVLVAGCGAFIAGCSDNTQVGTIQITPATQSLNAGQTAQFTATGIISHGKHPSSSQDVTSMVTWTSSSADIAAVNSSGVATALSAGTATITASMAGATSGTATITVTGSSGGKTGNNIGTTTGGATEDLTGQVTWTSSSSTVAAISSGGLATAIGQGTATITALATNPDKSVATGTATFTVTAGTREPVTALSITPTAESLSASGQKGQFIAIATLGANGLTQDVTNSPQVTWSSSIPSVATITSGLASGNGLAEGAGVGTTTITAVWTNPDGTVVSAAPATVNVTLSAAPNPLLSLTLIPTEITVGNLQGTGQFLAIGTFSSPPYVRDVTNSPNTTWISSFPDSFPVDTNNGGTSSASAGIVTAYGNGSATIIAEYTNPDPTNPTVQTATATFSCPLVLPNPPLTAGSCFPGSEATPLKVTLTVYGEGLNTTNWLVTAPSATGTPTVIHCGPGWANDGNSGGSVCVGIYPVDSQPILLTAPARPGVAFGGWTYNCTPSDSNGNPLSAPPYWTAAGPNYCTVNLNANTANVPTNVTVGAIFNNTN